MDWGGFVRPSQSRSQELRNEWRYRCYSFSAASPPFSFFRGKDLVSLRSFVGGEKVEPKNSELSILRKNHIAKSLATGQSSCSETQVPHMRKPKSGQKCSHSHQTWKSTAVRVQRLRPSIYRALVSISKILSLSFLHVFQTNRIEEEQF